jgi:hypothetical protein
VHDEQVTTAASPPGPAASELGPLSPELALVDPELARSARALLPDSPRIEPPRDVAAPLAPDRTNVDPVHETLAESSTHRRTRIPAATVTGCFVLAVLLTLVARHEAMPASQQLGRVVPSSTVATPAPPATTEKAAPAVPTTVPAEPTPAPRDGETFVWPSRADASAYEFQLFRREQRIFRARRTVPRLDLPLRWRQNGRLYELTPGEYRWYVWPISRRTGRQQDVAIVQAKLLIEAPQE